MLIIENNFSFRPLIDSTRESSELDTTCDYINEYINDSARRFVSKGEPKRVLHLSGLASYHHPRLIDYFKSQSALNLFKKIKMVHGEFGDTHLKHCWIMADDYIIDLTVSQFKILPGIAPSFIRRLLDTHCLISNNPSSLIYNLYRQVNE